MRSLSLLLVVSLTAALPQPDDILISYFLNTRREDLSDMSAEQGSRTPEDLGVRPDMDLGYLYQQLGLVNAIKDVLTGMSNARLPTEPDDASMLLLEEAYPRSNQPRPRQAEYNMAELFRRMQEGDNDNEGSRPRRAVNSGPAAMHRTTSTADKADDDEPCVLGTPAWPICKPLTKFKVDSLHKRRQHEQNKGEETGEKTDKKVDQKSARTYGGGDEIESARDEEDAEGEEHSVPEKGTGLRKKRESKSKEFWTDPLEGSGGKRAPDFHSWGGKRSQNVDLQEIYDSDPETWGDKRAPDFNSWGGKRATGRETGCGKGRGISPFNNWGSKRGPSFNSWGGKRAPEFNSWGGKRAAPFFNSWGGKRATPSFNSWGGKRATPSFNSWGGKRVPEFNSWGGKRKPAFNSWGGKRNTWMLQKMIDNNTMPGNAGATYDDSVDASGSEKIGVRVAKRGNVVSIREMVKAPNLPTVRSRASSFYPWGGKRSDSIPSQ